MNNHAPGIERERTYPTGEVPCDLSVVIISFNCWNLLKNCLLSIYFSSGTDFETIVLDNASLDGTPDRVREEFPQVRLLVNPLNIGHSKAFNQAVKHARGKRILLLDADTELLPEAIFTLHRFMESHADAWLAAPRTLNTDGTIQESARNFPSPLSGIFGRQSLLSRLFPDNPITRRYLGRENIGASEAFQVEFVSAACMLFDRRVLERVGPFDEGYPGYWVDADWCKRIRKSGGMIYCVPNAVIYHHEQNVSSRKRNPSRIIDFHTGVYRFYRIHYTFGGWDPRSAVAAILLTIRAIILLCANKFKKRGNYSDPLSLQRIK